MVFQAYASPDPLDPAVLLVLEEQEFIRIVWVVDTREEMRKVSEQHPRRSS